MSYISKEEFDSFWKNYEQRNAECQSFIEIDIYIYSLYYIINENKIVWCVCITSPSFKCPPDELQICWNEQEACWMDLEGYRLYGNDFRFPTFRDKQISKLILPYKKALSS